jgi:peptidase E
MIKFILHGGKSRIDCENNRKFYQTMFKLDKKEVNFLVVSFSKPKGSRDFSAELEKIVKLNLHKIINFQPATEEEFEQQIKEADVIYLRGGDAEPLKKELAALPDLVHLFAGKIVAGSSAGFIVLARYYYDQDYDSILEGLNILPVKAISHYGLPNMYCRDFATEIKNLQEYKKEEGLETIAIKETEFVARTS